MEKPYVINEQDIESAMRWLAINDPEHAERDDAMAMLQELKSGFHQISHNNPELLARLKEQLQRRREDRA